MVYVDNSRQERFGREWSHLVADSLDELHQFAAKQRFPRKWFHATAKYPHYDVTRWGRNRALSGGAIPVPKRELLLKAKALRDQSVGLGMASGFPTRSLGLFD